MREYHKIKTVFLRDPETKYKTLLVGQYATEEFSYLADNEWLWTEKVDGMNIRVMWDGNNVTFAGKTDKAQLPSNLVTYLQRAFTQEKMASQFGAGGGVCLYGEGFGAGIQKVGGLYSNSQTLCLFDVLVDERWLLREGVTEIAVSLGCSVAPIIGNGNLVQMVEYAKGGFNSNWGNFLAEGIVARPRVELFGRNGNRVITKIKHSDFLNQSRI